VSERIVQTPYGRCIERPKPGQPGVVERVYIEPKRDVYRPGLPMQMIESGTPPRRRSTAQRDVRSFGYGPEDVVIRERSTELTTFRVNLPPDVTKAIEEEIRLVRQEADADVEAGGFLFSANRPRLDFDWINVAHATRAEVTSHSRTRLEIGDPLELWGSLRAQGFPEQWRLCGDFHSHAYAGSTVPSDIDARAWAGLAEKIGLPRYVGIIVSPHAEIGWMAPTYSAWVVRRDGLPSKPVCEPAKVVR
jgi:hypothetical protein